MSIKIGHASIDENGKIVGGNIGDQTGKEICIRNWYSKPWNVYLECTDPVIADKATSFMEQICADPNYGYDQSQRITGYNSIKANGGKVVGAKGEFDCSSLVSTCYRLAGLNISPSSTTRSIRANFMATGKFKLYMDAAHLTSDKYAKRGGIYLKEGSHVVMALEDGTGDKNPYKEPMLTIRLGSKSEGVKWVQWALNQDGFKIDIDGSCGPITDQVIREYQRKHSLVVDGKVGTKTRQSMRR
ncbi:MAG: cell surface protein [Herbinix sp.]|jgi:hypothetical protein|nr:cell surface protein [Herbinix sp.]